MLGDSTDILSVTTEPDGVRIKVMNGNIYTRRCIGSETPEEVQRYYWSRGEIDDDCFFER